MEMYCCQVYFAYLSVYCSKWLEIIPNVMCIKVRAATTWSLTLGNLDASCFTIICLILQSTTYTDFLALCQQVSNMSEHSGSNSGSNSSTPSTPYPAGGGGNTTGTLPNTTATWPNLQETLQFERAASAIISDRPHTISSGDLSSMSSLTLFCKLVIHAQCKTGVFASLLEFCVICCFTMMLFLEWVTWVIESQISWVMKFAF